MTHSAMLYGLDISTFHFIFLAIAVSAFCPLKTYRNLVYYLVYYHYVMTVYSYVDNHFYKYIYLFQILSSMKLVFFIKMHLRFPYSNLI